MPAIIGATELTAEMIAAFDELGNSSSGGGALGDLLRGILKRNDEFRAQTSGGRNTLRELWLAIVDTPPTAALAQALASGLKMRVVIYPNPILFRPEFRLSPPETEDVHTFDGQGISFHP